MSYQKRHILIYLIKETSYRNFISFLGIHITAYPLSVFMLHIPRMDTEVVEQQTRCQHTQTNK